jgi:uncharacterized protein
MAETTDDLSTPLGQKSTRKRRFRLPFSGTQAIVAVLGLILATFLGFAIFTDNPMGGEPVARVAIRQTGTPPAEKPADRWTKDHHHDRRIDRRTPRCRGIR